MASDVDICNLALAYLGDTATLSSVNPPEGSAQSDHCHRFYPVARDTLLQMHNWNFASRRVLLARVENTYTMWKYAYALPADLMDAVAVLPPEAMDDYATPFAPSDTPFYAYNLPPVVAAGQYVPQRYDLEIDANGNRILLTNQENAMLRYQASITDTGRYPPLFVLTLSWHLASMLAGPLIKGAEGAAEGKRCSQMMAAYMQQAINQDSNQRNIKPEHIVPWTAGR